MARKQKFESDIQFGEKYRDENTGFEGVATGIYFFQYGCTRVTLVGLVAGDVKEFTFDEQGLEAVGNAKAVTSRARAGGSRPTPSRTEIRPCRTEIRP